MQKGAMLAALLLASCKVESAPPDIAVESAWARATVPGQTSAAVYLTVTNGGGDDHLVGVSSPAGRASIHSTSMADGIMRMRPVESVDIPENSTVELIPGGTHVMLAALERPLRAGTTIPLELRFDRSGDRQVSVTVRHASADGGTM